MSDQPERRVRLELDFLPRAYEALQVMKEEEGEESFAELIRKALLDRQRLRRKCRAGYRVQLVKGNLTELFTPS